MDLNPFHYINPCGYAGLEMCQLADFIGKEEATLDKVSPKLIKHFAELLGYNVIKFTNIHFYNTFKKCLNQAFFFRKEQCQRLLKWNAV